MGQHLTGDRSESQAHTDKLILCFGVLVDHHYQTHHLLSILLFKLCYVSDVDVSHYPDVCMSHAAHYDVSALKLFL